MKVISMQIENVLGIREFSLDAGQITEISGRNAEGKTSILTALQNAIGGGSLSELKNIKAGDEKARIVLTLQDGNGSNYVLDKTESSLKLKKQVGDSAAFETVGKPQNFINALRDCKLMNPMDFLNAKNDKERVELILQAIDLPFSRDDLWKAIGLPRNQFPPLPDGMNPLIEISETRKMVFEKRTGVNTSRRDKRAACEEERLSVPAEIPTVDGIGEKEKELSELRVKRQELKGEADSKLRDAERIASNDAERVDESASKTMSAFIDVEEKQLEIEIAKLREKMKDKIEEKRKEISYSTEDAYNKINAALRSAECKHKSDIDAIEELTPEIERLSSEIATMREQEKNAIRIATIHERADKLESEANDLDALADTLTESLRRIDAYKASLSDELPIDGLDITDNVVTIDGVPWAQLNTAAKVVSAVKIIAARAKKYPFKFCIVDGVESLDSSSRKVLSDTLLSNDIQAVLGRVTDSDMEVSK